jgi:hypothetical protein
VLGTLLRKDLAEAVGLTAQEVGGLLPGPALGRTVRGHAPTRNSNRLSATRKAICMLLSNPALGRGYADLEPIAREPEAAALRELLAVINADSTPAELNTATLLELFRDNPHLGVLKEANARNLDLNDSFGEADWQLQVEHLRSESRKLQAQQMYQNRSVADLKNDKSDLVRFGGRLPAGNVAAPGLVASEPDVPTTA